MVDLVPCLCTIRNINNFVTLYTFNRKLCFYATDCCAIYVHQHTYHQAVIGYIQARAARYIFAPDFQVIVWCPGTSRFLQYWNYRYCRLTHTRSEFALWIAESIVSLQALPQRYLQKCLQLHETFVKVEYEDFPQVSLIYPHLM